MILDPPWNGRLTPGPRMPSVQKFEQVIESHRSIPIKIGCYSVSEPGVEVGKDVIDGESVHVIKVCKTR